MPYREGRTVRHRAILVFFFCIAIATLSTAQESPHGDIKIKCAACHSPDSWKMRTDSAFDHATTGFSLTGQHQRIPCASCHENLVFTGKAHDCTSCHMDIHKGELGENCLRCHSTIAWVIPDMKERHQQTRFPLLGKHRIADCEECHNRPSPNRYAGTPLECITCHREEYLATTAPPHAANGLGTDCAPCHAVNSLTWPGSFNHASTGFPLQGAHQALMCSACHAGNNFTTLPTTCYECHQKDFTNTQNPAHVSRSFPHDCTLCHNQTAWQPATFDHNTTNFPLTGAHLATPCSACHLNNNYNLAYTGCYQCHQADYQSTNDPNHVALNYSHDCQNCHNTTSWNNATIDHTTTGFPLTGVHTALQCASCHANNNFNLAYTNCYQCHQTEYQSATSPNHAAQNYPQTCDNCHTTTTWSNATFDHTATGFPLTGSHTSLQCTSCHVNNNYGLTYTNCYQCHQTEYQGTTDPNHTQLNYSHSCDNCHTTASWANATIDHSTTGFPLTGAHTTLGCSSCHVNNNYNLTYTDCYQCHQADYQRPTDPNHTAANFAHDCTGCHTTTVWTGGTFNHAATGFTLTGAHTSLNCGSCHVSQNYSITYTGCYTCHAADYNGTTNPNHASAGFPTTCDNCHTTTSWAGATFNHTWFPMTHGNANGVCATCHTNPSDYSVFQCTICHTQSQTATQHSTVSGYVWNSVNCYSCHPTGGGG